MRQRAVLTRSLNTDQTAGGPTRVFLGHVVQQGGSYHVPRRRCQQTRGGVHAVKREVCGVGYYQDGNRRFPRRF